MRKTSGPCAGDEATMAIGPDQAAAVTAFNRFGFGARPGDLNAAASDPRGFLLEELWTVHIALIRDRAPTSGPKALQAYYLEQQQIRAERSKMAAIPPAAPSKAPTASMPPPALSMAPMAAAPPAGPPIAATTATPPATSSTAPRQIKLEPAKLEPA
jgi:uncharacterized protein (DUF1800 family)